MELPPRRAPRSSAFRNRSTCAPSAVLPFDGHPASPSQKLRREGHGEQNDVQAVLDFQACHVHSGPENDCGASGSDPGRHTGVCSSSVQKVYGERRGGHHDGKYETEPVPTSMPVASNATHTTIRKAMTQAPISATLFTARPPLRPPSRLSPRPTFPSTSPASPTTARWRQLSGDKHEGISHCEKLISDWSGAISKTDCNATLCF